MGEKLTTYERRESIKFYLLRERETIAIRSAFMFDVSRQTIMNDIVFLSRRLPITTKVGGGEGIFLDVKFETPKKYLTYATLRQLLRQISYTSQILM